MLQLLSLVSSGISAWSEQKKAKMDQKTVLESKKLDRINNSEMNEAEWDKLMAEGSKESWKDEYWTLVLSIPAILAFFPDAVPDNTGHFVAVKFHYRILYGYFFHSASIVCRFAAGCRGKRQV